MPVDGVDRKVMSRQVAKPLPESPALCHHELYLPSVFDRGGEVNKPDDEEAEGAQDYLEGERPTGRKGGREGRGGRM